jgi:hypothetical protein
MAVRPILSAQLLTAPTICRSLAFLSMVCERTEFAVARTPMLPVYVLIQ